MLLLCYPKCGTCKKAENWLKTNKIDYDYRNIKEDKPNLAELKKWYKSSGLELKRFFNTSGKLYKDLGLKNKLTQMSEKEMLELLSSDGLMVKRPILVKDELVLVGFKEAEWEKMFVK